MNFAKQNCLLPLAPASIPKTASKTVLPPTSQKINLLKPPENFWVHFVWLILAVANTQTSFGFEVKA